MIWVTERMVGDLGCREDWWVIWGAERMVVEMGCVEEGVMWGYRDNGE